MEIRDPNTQQGLSVTKAGRKGRADVSARSDERSYYNSRDEEKTYHVRSIDTGGPADGEFILYIKNTSTTQELIIHALSLGGLDSLRWILHQVTGTAAGSSALTPSNLNLGSSNDAEATCRGDGAITGLTSSKELGVYQTGADDGDNHIEIGDTIRLGQNDAIAIEVDDTQGTADAHAGVIFYYE